MSHHTGGLVHDNQAAGAHHGADGDKVVIVDGGINQLSGDAAAGGAAGLGSLEGVAARHAAADLLHHFPQGGAHGDFHQAGVGDFAAQGEHLGARGLLGADGAEPVSALEDDLGNVGVGLHVVQHGGHAEQALDSGEGRTDTGLAALALDGGHQSGFLAADEGAGAQADVDVKVKAGVEDVLAQQAVLAGLLDGNLQALDGDGYSARM